MDDNDVILAKNGDEEAMEKIFLKYRNYILKHNKYLFIKGGDYNDLLQEGYIGLLKAIRSYDKDKNVSFNHFANICIKRHIISSIQSANCMKKTILNNSLIGDDSSIDDFYQITNRYTPEEIVLGKELKNELNKYLISNLTEIEKGVCKYLCQGYTYREIAKELNQSLKRTDNAIQRVRKKILTHLEAYLK